MFALARINFLLLSSLTRDTCVLCSFLFLRRSVYETGFKCLTRSYIHSLIQTPVDQDRFVAHGSRSTVALHVSVPYADLLSDTSHSIVLVR